MPGSRGKRLDRAARKALRMQLIAKLGLVCPDCGVKMVWSTPDIVCASDRMATLDHILPLSKGGTNAKKNFRLCCRVCNIKRGNALMDATKGEGGGRCRPSSPCSAAGGDSRGSGSSVRTNDVPR